MKAIIPVAGIGSRLRPHTHTQPKSLIPVAGKPILGHILDQVIQAGVTDMVFVIGYLGDKVEQYVSVNFPNVNAEFIIQTTGRGIGHAIWLTRNMVGEEELLIVLGDTIFETDLKAVLQSDYSSLGVKKVDDPRQFGVAEVDEMGYIIKLIENISLKPAEKILEKVEKENLLIKLQLDLSKVMKKIEELKKAE